ncbi:MAG: hypothetical protein MJZ12_00505 [Prevotella sp.]|nr:hypothetical protein [Prevotella sp.]
MEHKIGEIVTMPDGRKARVTQAPTHHLLCSACICWEDYLTNCRCPVDFRCHKNEREDHTTIYYEEIKEGE